MDNHKIYIIAGEASGDILGAKLMEALRQESSSYIEFSGIGGDRMVGHGLVSLFPMSDISIMGFAEILPHIPKVLKRIRQTVDDILRVKPDVVITIDSPGFSCRVAEKLQGRGIKLIHYVAPTVWAYKPRRAEKFARLFNHLLLLLPFEKPYFDAVELPCTYVGHPIIEDIKLTGNAARFREKYIIKPEEKILCLMPGSRITEIKLLMPVFCKALKIITEQDPKIRPVILTIPFLKRAIHKYAWKLPPKTVIIDSHLEKPDVFAAAKVALAKSGTGTLELSLAGIPIIVTYKVNSLSYHLLKMMVKVKYVNLLNLVMCREIIPELLQNKCNGNDLSEAVLQLMNSEALRSSQVNDANEALKLLGLGDTISPSIKAAKTILGLCSYSHSS